MKKFLFFLLLIFVFFASFASVYYLKLFKHLPFVSSDQKNIQNHYRVSEPQTEIITTQELYYELYEGFVKKGDYESLEKAIEYGKGLERASVREKGRREILWDNIPDYNVCVPLKKTEDFGTLHDAFTYSKMQSSATIYQSRNNALLWDNSKPTPASHIIANVTNIEQLPELPRGCEVTSLAMLLRYFGYSADKMTLAEQIKKDNTTYSISNSNIFYGNPNVGFVGSMTDLNLNGYGVYSGPIFDLLLEYAYDTAANLSGSDFEIVQFHISCNNPVWVIVNSTYDELSPDMFETWTTNDGDISITYKEHSVLVTGYDESTVYFCDPLGKVFSAPKEGFVKAWEQMGHHAVTISR